MVATRLLVNRIRGQPFHHAMAGAESDQSTHIECDKQFWKVQAQAGSKSSAEQKETAQSEGLQTNLTTQPSIQGEGVDHLQKAVRRLARQEFSVVNHQLGTNKRMLFVHLLKSVEDIVTGHGRGHHVVINAKAWTAALPDERPGTLYARVFFFFFFFLRLRSRSSMHVSPPSHNVGWNLKTARGRLSGR